MGNKREAIDWAGIEVDYRAGVMSDRLIGKKYGVSHTAIQKRAKAEGWTRDLKARIRQKAEEKVASAAVAKKVASGSDPGKVATERVTVEANATLQANLTLEHRSSLGRLKAQVEGLAEELRQKSLTADERANMMVMIKDAIGPNVDEKRLKDIVNTFFKSLQLDVRIEGVRKLVAAMGELIKLERMVYGVSDVPEPEETYEARLLRLADS